jgi:zinc D-Ala-D-Ala carboxypeptidase
MQLSPNFSLKEMIFSEVGERKGFANNPNATELANLIRLCDVLEQVRAIINKPIIINSGFRSKPVNDAVGSRDTSQHRRGCAADFRVPGMTSKQVVEAIMDSDVPYDQLIDEFGSWVHFSVPNSPSERPRRQVLTIDRTGVKAFTK